MDTKSDFTSQEPIPGQDDDSVVQTIYFSTTSGQSHKSLFRKITSYTNPPAAQSGGVYEAGCAIEAPDGRVFYALQFHGDLDGWRQDIEAGAAAEKSVLARFENHALITQDGAKFAIADCKVSLI